MTKTSAPPQPSADEKRDHPRAAVEARTWARNPSQFASDSYDAAHTLGFPSKLTSLSFSGAKLLASSPLGTVGERVELVLPTTSHGENISAIGRVVRIERTERGYATALQFARVSVPDQMRLAQVLSILLSDLEAVEDQNAEDPAVSRSDTQVDASHPPTHYGL